MSVHEIQIKRGLESNRATVTPKEGEPLFTTDEKELFIGDGSTAGGFPVGTVKPSGGILADAVALFKDTTGKVLYAVTKAEFLKDYATEQYVNTHVSTTVPAIKVNEAKLADKATNSDSLKGRSDYLNTDVLTSSYQEDDVNKVVTASGIKAMWDVISGGKLSISNVVSSLTENSATKALSASAGKMLKDLIDNLQSTINTVSTTASNANKLSVKHEAHLKKLPPEVSRGTSVPVDGVGTDGDVYLQYK